MGVWGKGRKEPFSKGFSSPSPSRWRHLLSLTLSQHENAESGEEVGQEGNDSAFFIVMVGGNSNFLDDRHVHSRTEPAEISDRYDPDIRGVVPFIGQFLGHGRSSGEEHLEPVLVVGEIGERDNPELADSEHVPDTGFRVGNLHERLGEDNVVEGVVRVIFEFFVDISVNDGQSFGNGLTCGVLVDFYAGADNVLFSCQIAEQGAGPTTEVEDLAARFYP